MKVNDKLRGLREDRDLKLKDIADLLNTSTQYYQKYEKGKYPIPINHLQTLCLYYQVSADYILGLPEGLPYGHSKTKKKGGY